MAEVERFNVGPDSEHPGYSEMHPAKHGHWVRYSDYEQVKRERDSLLTGKLPSDHAVIRAEKAQAELEQVKSDYEALYRYTDLLLDNIPATDRHNEPSYRELVDQGLRLLSSLKGRRPC